MDLFSDFAKQNADLGAFGNGSPDEIRCQSPGCDTQRRYCRGHDPGAARRARSENGGRLVGPGAGGSRMFQMRAPMMVEGVYEPATMKVSTWKKDMAIIAEFADDVGCAIHLFTLTQPVYAEAIAMGLGDQDTAQCSKC
jgi:3-hydroxyisobutyrate dehydrogenase/glyoxylate/succinic semialdehyde reductase